MTDALPGAALLPGGTDMKAVPYRPKPGGSHYTYEEDENESALEIDLGVQPQQDQNISKATASSGSQRRALSERRTEQEPDISQYIPRVGYPRPFLPDAPFKIVDPPRRNENETGSSAGNTFATLKRPLIFPNSAREVLAPSSARLLASTSRSEPSTSRENILSAR